MHSHFPRIMVIVQFFPFFPFASFGDCLAEKQSASTSGGPHLKLNVLCVDESPLRTHLIQPAMLTHFFLKADLMHMVFVMKK